MSATPPAGRGRRVAGAALLALASLLPLLLIEVAARVLHLDDRVVGAVSKRLYPEGLFSGTRLWDPALQWRLHPDATLPNDVGHVNSLGLVGRETTWTKPAGTIRLLAMGDSVTYGLWACGKSVMCRTRPYTTALELRLWQQQQSDRVEVVNGGVYGYSTQQGARDFRQRLHRLTPDVVLVMYGWNDHGSQNGIEPRDPESPLLRSLLDRTQNLATYRMGMGLLTLATLQASQGGWGIPDQYVARVPLDEFDRNLTTLATEIRATGARVLFVTEPGGPFSQPYKDGSVPTPWELYRLPSYEALMAKHVEYMDVMRRAAVRLEVPLADPAAEFLHHDLAPLFDPYDMIHPNEAGSALMAQVVATRLDELGWLRP